MLTETVSPPCICGSRHGGVWAETLGKGDIDYTTLAAKLKEIRFGGPMITECAIEAGTPMKNEMAGGGTEKPRMGA